MLDALFFLAFVAALMAIPLVAAHRSTPPALVPSHPAPRFHEPRSVPAAVLAPLAWPEDDALPNIPLLDDTARQVRLRDRYLGARFPGVVRRVADFDDPIRVIRGARLLFEEGDVDRAAELLDLAIAGTPAEASLRLAALEMAFLQRDALRYASLAAALRESHPRHPEWPEVLRLGHALDPSERLFADAPPRFGHPHYGPWPDTPNWIQASWDLTADVLASEFHQAMVADAAIRKELQ